MIFKNNKTYDYLRYIVQTLLPAIGVLYAALSGIYGWPYAEAVLGTIAAIETFIGTLIGVSRKKYDTLNPPEVPVTEQANDQLN